MSEISFENRRAARVASDELREELGADWTREDERQLAEWYQELERFYAKDDDE